jgi:cation diffusion facilitator family transporter
VALAANIASTALKFAFGILANSIAMMSDGAHSVFDSASSVIGLYGNRGSAKPPDAQHPYGHRKLEYVASIGIATMLFIAFLNLLHESLDRLVQGDIPEITSYSFISVALSMSLSLSISLYERYIGRRVSSPILIADSHHSMTDVLASIVVLTSFVGTLQGAQYADPIAAIIVSVLIGYAGYSIWRESAKALMDQGIDSELTQQIKSIVGEFDGVKAHHIRGRVIGGKYYVDLHLTVDKDLHVQQAHDISEKVEKRLKEKIEGLEEAIMHLEPERPPSL